MNRRATWPHLFALLALAILFTSSPLAAQPVALDASAPPLFHLDLGNVLLHSERYQLAEAELQLALDLPNSHPGDALYAREARGQLQRAREQRVP